MIPFYQQSTNANNGRSSILYQVNITKKRRISRHVVILLTCLMLKVREKVDIFLRIVTSQGKVISQATVNRRTCHMNLPPLSQPVWPLPFNWIKSYVIISIALVVLHKNLGIFINDILATAQLHPRLDSGTVDFLFMLANIVSLSSELTKACATKLIIWFAFPSPLPTTPWIMELTEVLALWMVS